MKLRRACGSVSDPPSAKPPGPGAQARPGRGQGRLLVDLRRHRAGPGDRRPGRGPPAGQALRAKWRKLFPAAVECLEEDFEHLITYLRFPKEHHKRIRHSNFIERTFGETRRRVKVIGRLPGEQSCLSLVWAVLDRASAGWRGVEKTPAVVRCLQNLRRELIGPHGEHDDEEVADETVTAAA